MNIISCDQFFSQIAILDCQIGSTMFLPLLDNQLRFSLEQCAIQNISGLWLLRVPWICSEEMDSNPGAWGILTMNQEWWHTNP